MSASYDIYRPRPGVFVTITWIGADSTWRVRVSVTGEAAYRVADVDDLTDIPEAIERLAAPLHGPARFDG